jgi:hypothetical protein
VNDSGIDALGNSMPERNNDATYIQYLNSALRAVYGVRPDAFIGNFTQGILSSTGTPVITYSTSDLQTIDNVANPSAPVPATPFPVDDRIFFYPVVAYLAGRIELADDEYVAGGLQQSSARAQALMASFTQQLLGA